MAWTPISGTMTQYQTSTGALASSYYLKFYQSGTTTAFNMATDSTGGTTIDKAQLDSSGYPTTDGTTRFIPHINQKYKIVLYKNSTDADANTIANADWNIDAIDQSSTIADTEVIFETVAAMVASATLNVGDHVRTLGYLAIGDGGGNEYDIVAAATGTDDGGSYIDLATHQAQGLFPGKVYNFKQFGPTGDGVADDDAEIQAAIDATPAGGTLYGMPGETYLITGLSTSKDIIIDLNGSTLKSAALSNTSLSFTGNGQVLNGTLDNVWLGWSTASVTYGLVQKCSFINQTFSNTTATSNARGVVIDSCYFTGKAKGAAGTSSFPCFQMTTGAEQCKFINNDCYDVVAGVTSDGISALSNNVVMTGNSFETMEQYALKTDVGNYFVFKDNEVKDSVYGIFYEALNVSSVYSTDSGNHVVCTDNYFDDITSGCLYCVAATAAKIKGIFSNNYMTGCVYGVNRAVGHLLISGNHFFNGASLYYYGGGSLSSWDMTIRDNYINATTDPSLLSLGNDTDGTAIGGAIVCGALTDSTYRTSILIDNNRFDNYHTNAIQVASLGAFYPPVTITNNTFDAGANSVNHIVIGAAADLIIKGNKEIAACTNDEVYYPKIASRQANPLKNEDNTWSFSTTTPTTGGWLLGDLIKNKTPASAGNIGWVCVYSTTTTLSAGEPSGETSMAVTSGGSSVNGDIIGVLQDDGTIHWTTIASGGGTTTIVLTAGLTDAAASGNRVYYARWKSYGTIA